jgi:hypothetical protein
MVDARICPYTTRSTHIMDDSQATKGGLCLEILEAGSVMPTTSLQVLLIATHNLITCTI